MADQPGKGRCLQRPGRREGNGPYLVPARLEESTHPRGMRARLHDDRRARMTRGEGGQGLARVGDGLLGENLARATEDADRVRAIPEVDPDGFFVRRVHKA